MAYTYNKLVADKRTPGSIANWGNRKDLPVTDILHEAEAKIYSKLRVFEMVTRAPITLTSGNETATAESDFLQGLTIKWNADGRPIDLKDPVGFEESCFRDENGKLPDGMPSFYSAIPNDNGGGTYYFETEADEDYSGFQWYYRRPAPLSPTNQTNFLTNRYPTLLRRACMMFAYEHQQDFDRAARTEASVNQMLFDANVEADIALNGAIHDSQVR